MEDLRSEMGQFKDQITMAEGKATQAEQQVRQAGEVLAVERQRATEHVAEAKQLARRAEEMLAKERSMLVTRINQLEERITAEAHREPGHTQDEVMVIPFSNRNNPLPSVQLTHGGAMSPSGVSNFAMELDSEERNRTTASQGQAARPIPANFSAMDNEPAIVPSQNAPIASGSRNTQAVRNIYCGMNSLTVPPIGIYSSRADEFQKADKNESDSPWKYTATATYEEWFYYNSDDPS